MRATPLHDVHARLGATFTSFAGWRMPLRYDSDLAEHHAVRRQAGLFDLSHMGQIEVSGPQAAEMLDFALVSRLSALPVGGARYTMLCHDTGGIIDDLVVYRLAADRFLAVANAKNAEVVRAMLGDHAHGYAVGVHLLDDRALIALQGPLAEPVLASLTAAPTADLRYYACAPAVVADRRVLLARTGYTGEDGFELYCAAADAAHVWSRLLDAGGAVGVRPAGLACRDTLRLEVRMPLHGSELHVGLTPFEAGLGRVVDFAKGDFVGRAALLARQERPTGEILAGLTGTGRRAARAGYAITDLGTGARIGTVTSGALSPTLGYPVALGYLPSGAARPGTPVGVDIRGTTETFTVTSGRFYKGRQA